MGRLLGRFFSATATGFHALPPFSTDEHGLSRVQVDATLGAGDGGDIRTQQLKALDEHEAELRRTVEELAAATVRAWERFRGEVDGL